ncbi:MAG: hypothetical protein KDD70_06935 [Bdellovibrionales bacterium]|nr:hypothetical protein [Bdellovibrionales bacterium]
MKDNGTSSSIAFENTAFFMNFALRVVFLSILTSFFFGSLGCSQTKSDFEIQKEEKEEAIERQEAERERQKRERMDIERQKFWNEQLKRYE